MTGSALLWMTIAAVLLSGLAVVLDRVNFPQRPFRSRSVITEGKGAKRDRTGAHVAHEEPNETS